jgi:DNA-binding NarL/FixJ family response regulator
MTVKPQRRSPRRAGTIIEVLVADDHPLVRHGLKMALGETPDIVVVGEASDAHEVLAHVRAGRGDVLILDLSMPGSSGIDLLETVRRERPSLRVLILSMYSVDQYAVRALRAGAAGYMTKESPGAELATAVRTIHAGRRYLTAEVSNQLAAELGTDSERPLHEHLSEREYQVLRLFGRALSGGQIARRLHISEKTVSTYRTRLLEKLRVGSTAELIRYAVKHRLDE